jgi:hypothetical protein
VKKNQYSKTKSVYLAAVYSKVFAHFHNSSVQKSMTLPLQEVFGEKRTDSN